MVFVPPDIPDESIQQICRVLGLPETAFSGADGRDPRLQVLKSLETRDIEACPGSGKTTLLVAKLAGLGALWSASRCGLCVLSHTNVARREIEERLGNTAEGQRLLSYPHFIGTIHGFVNEFLAMPWLRSQGYPVEMIDDEVTLSRRWWKLRPNVRSGLENTGHDSGVLRIRDTDFRVGELRWGKGGTLREDSKTYQALIAACRESAQEGFFCHDEMFVWAHDLIDKVPEVTTLLRTRFPVLFIDEVQDNSEAQSKLLHRIFVEGDGAVRRQRYGDANQAIYQYAGQTDGAETDRFPIADGLADIPNSFRFGQGIADLADPLALTPQGLQGNRQRKDGEADTTGKHAIFLFDDDSITRVLEAYCAYLIELFSEQELGDGVFTAVGAVHSPTGNDKVPRHVGHYWPTYDHEINRADPQPQTFVQYVTAGRRLSEQSGETHAFVEKIAEAVIGLVRIADSEFRTEARKRKHRYVLQLLENAADAKKVYLDLVGELAVERTPISEVDWNNGRRGRLIEIAQAITGAQVEDEGDIAAFLEWGAAVDNAPDQGLHPQSDNLFRYPADNPAVAVRVGSIHSVKGETHTATLVLETFYRAHHLKTLKSWLMGDRSGGDGATAAVKSRLKLHYVAMTRPAHLLCLALRDDSLEAGEITKLQEHGWRIARVGAAGPEWLDEAPGSDR